MLHLSFIFYSDNSKFNSWLNFSFIRFNSSCRTSLFYARIILLLGPLVVEYLFGRAWYCIEYCKYCKKIICDSCLLLCYDIGHNHDLTIIVPFFLAFSPENFPSSAHCWPRSINGQCGSIRLSDFNWLMLVYPLQSVFLFLYMIILIKHWL